MIYYTLIGNHLDKDKAEHYHCKHGGEGLLSKLTAWKIVFEYLIILFYSGVINIQVCNVMIQQLYTFLSVHQDKCI